MTTDPHDEHGEILRRALHAEADTVTPAGDGLERIRARIAAGERRRFGREWFTANWARPVLAVAAAVAIAGLGVTAPQTIDLIQHSVGSNNPSGGDDHDATKGEHTEPQDPGVPPGPSGSTGGTTAGSSSSSETPIPASPPGSTACASPDASPTAAAKSRGTGAPKPPRGSCSSPSPSVTPTPPTSPTPPTTPTPSETNKPTEEPTPPPSSSAPVTTDQGAASTT